MCIPDGEAHVFQDKLYVYGSYDLPDTAEGFYCSEEYHVASTGDMLTWEVGEKSLDGKDIPWADDRHKKKYYIVDMGTFEVVLSCEGELTVHAVTFRNTK